MRNRLFILTIGAYKFTPSLTGTLLMISVSVLCVSLGSWQLRRADEKAALLLAWQDVTSLPAVAFNHPQQELRPGQAIVITGRYQPARQFLLDNQVHQGKFGYNVYTPFSLTTGGELLINRGWLPAPLTRAVLPEVSVSSDRQSLSVRGYARLGLPPVFGGHVAETERWPVRIQVPDVQLMAQLATLRLVSDMEMWLLPGHVGALKVIPPVAGLKPAKHSAYALQWFAFSSLAVILWLFLGVSRKA